VCTLRDEYLEKPKKNISQDTITDLYLKNIKKHIADIDDMYSCESIENIEEFLSQIP
jgi:hypothetical protein